MSDPAPNNASTVGEAPKIPSTIRLTIADAEGQKSQSSAIVVAKLVLEYAKVLVWPIFVASVLLIYQPPIIPILKSLADKLESASSVKIGSLSLEVQQKASDLGSPGLGLKIGQLSSESIEELLQIRGNGSMILLSQNGGNKFGLPKEPRLRALLDLEQKGLVQPYRDSGKEFPSLAKFVAYVKSVGKFSKPNPDNETEFDNFEVNDPDGKITPKFQHFGYELTSAGHKAVEAITKAVAAQLAKG